MVAVFSNSFFLVLLVPKETTVATNMRKGRMDVSPVLFFWDFLTSYRLKHTGKF